MPLRDVSRTWKPYSAGPSRRLVRRNEIPLQKYPALLGKFLRTAISSERFHPASLENPQRESFRFSIALSQDSQIISPLRAARFTQLRSKRTCELSFTLKLMSW
jgi:hypothetical protein